MLKDKKKSRIYLEEALSAAKKLLPGWMFAVIHQAAFPRAGGKAKAARNKPTALEEEGLKKINRKTLKRCEDNELKYLWKQVKTWHKTVDRQASDGQKGSYLDMVIPFYEEIQKRKFGYADELTKACDGRKKELKEWSKLQKGFRSGNDDHGFHAHGLNRGADQTSMDGGHCHLFKFPGGFYVRTFEDGIHRHELLSKDNKTAIDGAHSHKIYYEDKEFTTKIDGMHNHSLMFETTGLDGVHVHELKLDEETTIKSLTPYEGVELFGMPSGGVNLWASEIIGAINELRERQPRVWEDAQAGNIPDTIGVEEVYQALKAGSVSITGKEYTNEAELTQAICNDLKLSRVAIEIIAKGEPRSLSTVPHLHVEVLEKNGEDVLLGIQDGEAYRTVEAKCAFDADVGDIVIYRGKGNVYAFSTKRHPMTMEQYVAETEKAELVKRYFSPVEFVGPSDAKVVFVSTSPSALEVVRKESVVGQDGDIFLKSYLQPLGLTKADVGRGFVIPIETEDIEEPHLFRWRLWLEKQLDRFPEAKIVALGQVAKQAIGTKTDFVMPHPSAIRRWGDRGEVGRKIRHVRKALDKDPKTATIKNRGPKSSQLTTSHTQAEKKQTTIRVAKAADEKQIVYGVVLDPYQVDAHNDWIPPAEIEKTAHRFMKEARVIGLEHSGQAKANVVESWVENYPTTKDYKSAMDNDPHAVIRRTFGEDTIHSGAWVLGVELGDAEWSMFKAGELGTFSIGGLSLKTQVDSAIMPDVTYIDLTKQESARG